MHRITAQADSVTAVTDACLRRMSGNTSAIPHETAAASHSASERGTIRLFQIWGPNDHPQTLLTIAVQKILDRPTAAISNSYVIHVFAKDFYNDLHAVQSTQQRFVGICACSKAQKPRQLAHTPEEQQQQ
jgi:hypothetical protein